MQILHLFRKNGCTFARVEDSSSDPLAASSKEDGVAGLIAKLLRKPTAAAPETLELTLPCHATPPLSSPRPILSTMLARLDPSAIHLASCPVCALRLTPNETLELLSKIQGRNKFGEGLFPSASTVAFAHLLTAAASLVSRGRMLPSIKIDNSPHPPCALWRSAPAPEDALLLETLRNQMPSCCGDGIAAADAARELFEELVDALTRRCCVTLLSEAQAARRHFYSAHEAWFAALRSTDSHIRWNNRADLEELASSIAAWQDAAIRQPATGCSLHFILHAPATENGQWQLEIAKRTPEGLRAFGSGDEDRRAWLLALGQAIPLFPALADAKSEGEALVVHLTREGAWIYLSEGRRTLEAGGFTIDETTAVQQCEVGIAANVINETTEAEEPQLDQPLRVTWTITLNGEELSEEESASFIADATPLAFFRGRWIIIDPEALREAIRAAEKSVPELVTGRELIGLSLGAERYRGVAVQKINAGAWLDRTLAKFGKAEELDRQEQPEDFHGMMRPYQRRGFAWIKFLAGCGFGACLADDMGLGKTIQTLAFLLDRKRAGATRPALIIAPVSILGNWLRESTVFAPSLKLHLHHGSKRLKHAEFLAASQNCDVVLSGYSTLVRDFGFLRKVQWSSLILDEAQNVKNPDTRQSATARAISADTRLALTGTPVENHVGELWSIMDILNPGLLGSRESFRERFFKPIHLSDDKEVQRKLKVLTGPFLLRRLKTDKNIISDLPEKIESKIYCPLTKEQAALYRSVTEDLKLEMQRGGSRRTGAVFAAITALKQICNHPSAYLKDGHRSIARSGKLMRLTEMLEECFEAGESALVFTQYAQSVKLIHDALQERFGLDMPVLHGSMSQAERVKAVDTFQNGRTPSAFILSLRAGGTGLNLTRAANVFHYDRWWNPAVENQATDRAFRIGQTANVTVNKFICNGTLEEKIDRILSDKDALADSIIASGEKAFGGLSDEEIVEILSLEDDILHIDGEEE